MAKLYPPNISGTLPAFTNEVLTIPFIANRTVRNDDVIGFALLIKDLYNNTLGVTQTKAYDLIAQTVSFNLSNLPLIIGDYYKVQIAYINTENEIGYYSTIGIVKYTTQPVVSIENLTASNINAAQQKYLGIFSQIGNNDVTEKLYSSHFCFYDLDGNLLKQTEEKIHNSALDSSHNEQEEELEIDFELANFDEYLICFVTTSLNGLQNKSSLYHIKQVELITQNYNFTLFAENNMEEGYVSLNLQNIHSTSLNGSFVLSRINIKDNSFIVLKTFYFKYADPIEWQYRDLTIEQGQEYLYQLQQFNDKGFYATPIQSNIVLTDFEHIFLTDGKKQLKIKYNPKISSFKDTVQEAKVDTIGSKYPFIFKNPIIKYKEFPISGLISYLSDDEGLFLSSSIIQEEERLNSINLINQYFSSEANTERNLIAKKLFDIYTIELADTLIEDGGLLYFNNQGEIVLKQKLLNKGVKTLAQEITKEREWKLAVLDWLNNGEVKLFKSPVEGNYLVRLLNISLTPEDRLGRQLHSFQCTAYEVADAAVDNFRKYNILSEDDEIQNVATWSSWVMTDYSKITQATTINIDNILGLQVSGFKPGSKIELLFKGAREVETIIIGATGTYSIDNVTITQVTLPNPLLFNGVIHYKHYSSIGGLTNVDQIIYHPSKLFSVFGYDQSDIYYMQDNIKYQIMAINCLKLEKLNIVQVSEMPSVEKRNITEIYQVGSTFYNYQGEELKDFSLDKCFKFQYNKNEIDLAEHYLPTFEIDLKDQLNFDLVVGQGLKLDIGFIFKEKKFNIENTNIRLQNLYNILKSNPNKENYNNYIQLLTQLLGGEDNK